MLSFLKGNRVLKGVFMKKILTVMLAVSICLIFAGCSSKPNPVTGYKKGDVVLGQYKGLTYTRLSE